MIRFPIALSFGLLCFALSCGHMAQEYTRRDKLATIAILEDTRSMGKGELLDFLTDPAPQVRAYAVQALGRIGWPHTATEVAKLMTDSVESVRLQVAFALGQLGDASTLQAITSNLSNEKSVDVKCEMLEALGKIGDPIVIATLMDYFSDPEPAYREAAAFAISNIQGHGRIPDLIQLSRDSIEDVRWKAVYAMMRTGDSTAFGRLRWCLKDSSSLVRQYAARAIGTLGDKAGLKYLTDRLRREKSSLVKVNLIRSIAQVGDKKALKSLLNILSGKHADRVKAEAITAIGQLKLKMAIAKLKPYLKDSNRTIRGAAITAVAQIDPDFFMKNVDSLLVDAGWITKSRIIDGLGAVATPSALDVLADLFNDKDARVRRQTLETIAKFKIVDSHPYADKGLNDPDLTVNITAVDIIGSNRDTTFISRLADIYPKHETDNEPDLRLAVVGLFSDWIDSASPDHRMLEIFNKALGDVEYRVRKAAVSAFAKIGTDHSSSLGDYVTDITRENYIELFERYASNPTAIIKTNRGDITLELFYDTAPKTVNNFIHLAESGFYNGNIWHRVIPCFVIQDGCPRGDGWGGPGYTIRCEYNRKRFIRGTVGMAHAGKDTGGSQFFITHTALPHLDGHYTAFGLVTSGMSVVDRIEAGDSIRAIEITAAENTE